MNEETIALLNKHFDLACLAVLHVDAELDVARVT